MKTNLKSVDAVYERYNTLAKYENYDFSAIKSSDGTIDAGFIKTMCDKAKALSSYEGKESVVNGTNDENVKIYNELDGGFYEYGYNYYQQKMQQAGNNNIVSKEEYSRRLKDLITEGASQSIRKSEEWKALYKFTYSESAAQLQKDLEDYSYTYEDMAGSKTQFDNSKKKYDESRKARDEAKKAFEEHPYGKTGFDLQGDIDDKTLQSIDYEKQIKGLDREIGLLTGDRKSAEQRFMKLSDKANFNKPLDIIKSMQEQVQEFIDDEAYTYEDLKKQREEVQNKIDAIRKKYEEPIAEAEEKIAKAEEEYNKHPYIALENRYNFLERWMQDESFVEKTLKANELIDTDTLRYADFVEASTGQELDENHPYYNKPPKEVFSIYKEEFDKINKEYKEKSKKQTTEEKNEIDKLKKPVSDAKGKYFEIFDKMNDETAELRALLGDLNDQFKEAERNYLEGISELRKKIANNLKATKDNELVELSEKIDGTLSEKNIADVLEQGFKSVEEKQNKELKELPDQIKSINNTIEEKTRQFDEASRNKLVTDKELADAKTKRDLEEKYVYNKETYKIIKQNFREDIIKISDSFEPVQDIEELKAEERLIKEAEQLWKNRDYNKGLHINTAEYNRMIKALEVVARWNDPEMQRKLAENKDGPKTFKDALSALEDSAALYDKAKRAQTRNNPSAMRLQRLAYADALTNFSQMGKKIVDKLEETKRIMENQPVSEINKLGNLKTEYEKAIEKQKSLREKEAQQEEKYRQEDLALHKEQKEKEEREKIENEKREQEERERAEREKRERAEIDRKTEEEWDIMEKGRKAEYERLAKERELKEKIAEEQRIKEQKNISKYADAPRDNESKKKMAADIYNNVKECLKELEDYKGMTYKDIEEDLGDYIDMDYMVNVLEIVKKDEVENIELTDLYGRVEKECKNLGVDLSEKVKDDEGMEEEIDEMVI